MPTLTASPSSLISTKACLNCLSEKELKAIMVYAMRTSAGLTMAQVKNGAACYQILSKKQMLVALTAMIVNQLVPTLSVNDLSNATGCKNCGADSWNDAHLLFLFANYFQATAV
jgi:lactam utilization protein B